MSEPQAAFRALADPSRRAILIHLSERDMSIGDVVERFSMTRAAIKKHLTVLEEGKLISVHVQGRERINRLEPEGLKPIAGWIAYFEHFWDERLTSLEHAIDTHEEEQDD